MIIFKEFPLEFLSKGLKNEHIIRLIFLFIELTTVKAILLCRYDIINRFFKYQLGYLYN